MGVTGLWTVVQPCARPIKIETLNRKRLAVDASIWIYQFLKAVRDKEGNALRNSHVVGFFRRICKLLFLGIKPVFVFDGGAPTLKRQTISGRKARREGRREDAVRTAGKLLALQMQRRAEEEEQKRKESARRPTEREEEPLPENLVYVDEIQMSKQERQQNRKFKKKDQYHLPELDVSISELAGANDPRVMSLEELEQYARQFDSGEDINVYDFSKIDFNSPFFMSLPASDRYNILNAARLRSRLRMGHTKEQLDSMFPDRMAFSRFQIERVTERNELTQRLMHLSGMTDDSMFNGGGRVAGEKGREYVLVKNDGVEGGWALGVIGEKDKGEREKPIDVDAWDNQPKEQVPADEWEDEDDGFEDVPIEGLNRLPKLPSQSKISTAENTSRSILQRRVGEYAAKRRPNKARPAPTPKPALAREDSNALFVDQEPTSSMAEHPAPTAEDDAADDDDLQRAIAMSLENDNRASSPDDDDFEEVFNEKVPQQHSELNGKSNGYPSGPPSTIVKGSVSTMPFQDESDDDTMDFAGALAESRKSKYQARPARREPTTASTINPLLKAATIEKPAFDGPLPFERLDLGSSLLGRKKAEQLEEEREGGFEKGDAVTSEKKRAATPPPWFSGDIEKDIDAQKALEEHDRKQERQMEEEEAEFRPKRRLRDREAVEVVDVDAIEEKLKNVIDVESSDEAVEEDTEPTAAIVEDPKIRMGDIADKVRVEPPPPSKAAEVPVVSPADAQATHQSEEEDYEWEASDNEAQVSPQHATDQLSEPDREEARSATPKSASPEFENVNIVDSSVMPQVENTDMPSRAEANEEDGTEQHQGSAMPEDDEEDEEAILPASGTADDQVPEDDDADSDAHEYYSDIEDEELMAQLATEAEEHARFASQLNQKSQRQNIEEYERELKSLRTQQKKDRRDADEVSQVMITECQQLLRLFGLPYITAPMEAEAQCAELVSLGLVDGIVTDDSDIFLFGGTRVYKNMFNQAKYVECYIATDLEREFDLTRTKMIALANLLGSDYTEGLPGVGPVTALEIVSEFPQGLDTFREWWSLVQTGVPAAETDAGSAFRRKFRRSNATKLFLAPGFPDKRVEAAYLHPEVDSDPSVFQWGVPDLDALRAYLMATIGWSQERTDEVLVPVIRDINRRDVEGTQANITQFLGSGVSVGAGAFAPRKKVMGKSRRMEEALERMAGRARKRRKTKVGEGREANGSDGEDSEDGGHVAALDGVDAIVAQEGSLVEQPGLVGMAQVIPVPASSSAAKDGSAKQDKSNGKRVRSKKRKAAATATADGDGDDVRPAGSDEEEFVPKTKKRKARRKGTA